MTGDAWFGELSALDSLFLDAERPEAPLHAGGVYVCEGISPSARAGGAPGVARTLEARLHLLPRHRQKVRLRPLGLGRPVWVDDADFDLSYHVRRAALTGPGDDAALRDYAARVFARPLDRTRPLWELHVVEGLSGGRVALIEKVHPALADGASGLDPWTLLFDPEPEPRAAARPRRWRPRPEPGGRALALETLCGLRRQGSLTLAARLPGLARAAAGTALGPAWAELAFLGDAARPGHRLFFNRPIGARRRLRHLALPLPWVRQVKAALGTTVDDVLLAVVAEGLRRWLLERGERVPERIRVLCPVDVRDRRHRLGGSELVVQLPLGAMPPVTRLARVAALTGMKGARQAVGAAGALGAVSTMVVSHVPGPQAPVYTGGARLLEVWPLMPLPPRLGLNVAFLSYDGMVHIGLLADGELVPDLDRFVRHLGAAATGYRDLARRLRGPYPAPALVPEPAAIEGAAGRPRGAALRPREAAGI